MLKGKNVNRKSGVMLKLVRGTIICLVLTLLCAGVMAFLLERERIGENSMKIGAVIGTFLSAAGGTAAVLHECEKQKLQMSALVALCYFGALLGITAAVFDGQYTGIAETAISVVLGSATALLAGNIHLKGRRRPNIRAQFR